MEGATTTTMDTFLSTFTTFLTSLITWLGDLLTFVTAQPLLLAFVLIALAASVIAMIKRWLPGRT